MAAAVKFIHCADLHLGSAFLGLGRDLPELAGRLAEAPFAAFARIVDLALREEVDFLVIAGDIFDRDNPSLSGRMRFREELLRLDAAKIPVFLSGGNHDPVPAAWPPAVSLPGNTRLFSADTVEFFPVERNGEVIARVGGLSHSRLRQTDNLVERFAAPPGGPFTVGVLHANVGAQPGFQPYAPAAVADLAGRGVDYWALGHVHNFRKVNEAAPAAYYPGCPQGRAVNEPGNAAVCWCRSIPPAGFRSTFAPWRQCGSKCWRSSDWRTSKVSTSWRAAAVRGRRSSAATHRF
ncbi:MAG: DNA repair exonuclease [Lentisphaeria bacterium]|nr:MAG: DNA repair exonuclease [Lentisphaeria bacterium]